MDQSTDEFSTLRTEVLDLQKQRLALLTGSIIPVGAALAWLLDRKDWSWPFAAIFPLSVMVAATVLVLFTTRWIMLINTYLEATEKGAWNHHVTLFSRERHLPRFGWAVCAVNATIGLGSAVLLSVQCRGPIRPLHWIGFGAAVLLFAISNLVLVVTYRKSELLRTWRSVLGKPKLVLVGGSVASGKTYIAGQLAPRIPGAVLLDKDTLAWRFTDALLVAAGESAKQRDSSTYLDQIRPLEYDSLLSVAKDNLKVGRTVLAVAPFTYEVTNDDWLRELQRGLPGVEIWTIWMTSGVKSTRARMVARNAPYDAQKLSDWPAWEAKLLKLPAPKPGPGVLTISNDIGEEERLEAQLNRVLRAICPHSGPLRG